MTDIARLGAEFDGRSIEVAVKILDKLSVEAAAAEVAVKKLAQTQTSAAAAIARGNAQSASSALKIAQASGTATKEQLKQLQTQSKSASAAYSAAQALDTQASAALKAASANLALANSAQQVVTGSVHATHSTQAFNNSLRSMGQTAGQQQANMTNMIAQFQDIGVTAAMGMNPMMVALQQGSQMSLVFANAAMQAGGPGGAVKLLGQSLLGLLSPITLLTVGLTAGAVALIQWVDWADMAKKTLIFIADILPELTAGLVLFGGAMAIAFAPQVLTTIRAMTVAIGVGLFNAIVTATGAMIGFAIANPFAAVSLAIMAVLAVAFTFRDEITKIFGSDILEPIAYGAEFILDVFITAFNTLRKTWSKLPSLLGEITIDMANNVIVGVNKMIAEAIIALNPLLRMAETVGIDIGQDAIRGAFGGSGPIPNPFRGSYKEVSSVGAQEWDKARATDNFGAIVKWGGDFIESLADTLRKYAEGIGGKKDGKSAGSAGGSGAGSIKQEKTDAEKFLDIINEANNALAMLQREYDAIGLVGVAAKQFAFETDLLNKARAAGIALGVAELSIIERVSQAMAEQAQKNENKTAFVEQRNALMENIDNLNTEIETFGMSTEAVEMARFERQLLNDEIYRGIQLGDDQKRVLRELKGEEIALTAELRKRREEMGFQKGVMRGFLGDLRDGLENGKSFWKSFGDAAMNVLDKIINKLMDDLVDALFQVNKSATSGGGSGLLGGIIGAIGGVFDGAGGPLSNGSAPTKFAKGGVFTNSVVSSPTAFFAKGGTPGIMGEAGPEAIMPLARGPDGSLGVQMHQQANGGGGGGQPIIFDMSGAVITADLLAQVENIAAQRADIAVIQNNTRQQRRDQRRLSK